MALRNIRTQGDSILTKKCRKVEAMTPKLKELIEDMFETMYDAYGDRGRGLSEPSGNVRYCDSPQLREGESAQ